MAHRKIAVSIPSETVENLDYVAGRMKVTRSALISNMLDQPVLDLKSLLQGLPENPSKEDILHSRGASAALINGRLDSLRSQSDDLFSK